jgi:hypothetical protein
MVNYLIEAIIYLKNKSSEGDSLNSATDQLNIFAHVKAIVTRYKIVIVAIAASIFEFFATICFF